jgi:hypothetical protein
MRDSECPHCTAYLRCCRNCGFYDLNAHNLCHEPMADLQSDKEVANMCDYFRVAEKVNPGGSPSKPDLGGLFKDG